MTNGDEVNDKWDAGMTNAILPSPLEGEGQGGGSCPVSWVQPPPLAQPAQQPLQRQKKSEVVK